MEDLKKLKTAMYCYFVASGCFFLVCLGYLETKHYPSFVIFMVLALLFFSVGRRNQKYIGRKTKS